MIVSRVFACRPRRPANEREAVINAARGIRGSVAAIARQIARTVAAEAIAEIDRDPGDEIIGLLRALERPAINMLATDPEIDTAAIIRAERTAALLARGGRRLPESEWEEEDRRTLAKAENVLAGRYARILRAEFCS